MSIDQSDFERYNHPSPPLLDLASESDFKHPVILDVGCWGGALGARLKRWMNCVIDGIDINAQVLDIALSNGYRQVFCLDLNVDSLDAIENQEYDIIVLGDILEHTVDPGLVLDRLISKLRPEGVLLVSLPNIGFIWYRLVHLAGIWEYKSSGVMDRTHLRFFTYRSMKKFFRNHCLEVLEVRPYIGIRNWPWPIRRAMRALAVVWPALFALQIVFKIRVKSEE